MKSFHTVLTSTALCATCLAQVHSEKLLAFDGHELHSFGSAVGVDGDWIIVGAIHDFDLGTASGAAYAYQRRGAGWQFVHKFSGHDTSQSDTFGGTIALEQSTCVIGATSEFPNGIAAAGAVYVFERVGTQWIETQKLVATPAIANATFGWSMALDGNRLLVGARGENSPSSNAGAVYVFERVGGVWSQTARLVASDPAPFDFFGQSLAVHGDTAMVGSTSDGPAGGSQGAVYVFEFDGVQWNEIAKLRASDPNASSSFSSGIALGFSIALVGSVTHDHAGSGSSGAAYVFHRAGGVWQQVEERLQHASGPSLRFGGVSEFSGNFTVIGASKDPNHIQGRGAAYVFRREPTGWVEIARVDAFDGANGDSFGNRLSLDGTTVVAGVPSRDDFCGNAPSACNSGAVYVFEFCPDARQFGWCMSGAPCANHDKNAGCINSTGVGATLGAAGSSSVALDELRFEVRRMQPLKSAILFMGNGVGQAVLGDGLRVVASASSGFYRYGVMQSGPDGAFQQAGTVSHSQLFPPTGQIQPGSVWNFQCWYRDPSGPCGAGTNVTNALEVTFRP